LENTHVKQEGRKEILAGEFVQVARAASEEKFGKCGDLVVRSDSTVIAWRE